MRSQQPLQIHLFWADNNEDACVNAEPNVCLITFCAQVVTICANPLRVAQLLGLKAPEQTTIVDAQPEQKQRDCNEQKQGKSLMQLEELNDAIGDLQQSVKEDLKRGKPLRMTEANRKRAM